MIKNYCCIICSSDKGKSFFITDGMVMCSDCYKRYSLLKELGQ